jgi:hypothetical protein
MSLSTYPITTVGELKGILREVPDATPILLSESLEDWPLAAEELQVTLHWTGRPERAHRVTIDLAWDAEADHG